MDDNDGRLDDDESENGSWSGVGIEVSVRTEEVIAESKSGNVLGLVEMAVMLLAGMKALAVKSGRGGRKVELAGRSGVFGLITKVVCGLSMEELLAAGIGRGGR